MNELQRTATQEPRRAWNRKRIVRIVLLLVLIVAIALVALIIATPICGC